MSYIQCLRRLYRLKGKNGEQLDNLRHADNALGNPSAAFASIHVAGTNGKGSVSTKIAKALEAAGWKTGLYTSPHLSSFRERICINSIPIGEDIFTKHLNAIFNLVDKAGIPLFFFDLTTLLAFYHFAQEKVDFAVIETGLGGRLDATNIISPVLSIITSIDYDHTAILGETLEDIAREKAGIIKMSIPTIIGPTVPFNIISPIAMAKNSSLLHVKGDFDTYLEENTAIAKAAMEQLKIPSHAQAAGLQALPPCRLEFRQMGECKVVLDVAHNPSGLRSLFQALQRSHPAHRYKIVIGLSDHKDLKGCIAELKKAGTNFYVVEAPNGRGAAAHELAQALAPRSTAYDSIPSAVMQAIADADPSLEIVVICGSFYIMQEARLALGMNELRDPDIADQI